MNRNPHDGSQTIFRAFQVLEAFSGSGGELGVRELSRRLDLPKSTTHRLVTSLQVVGALEQNPETDKYRLGLKLFELGSLAAQQRGFQEQVHEHLEALVTHTGETVHLAVLDPDGYAVLVDKVAGPRAVTVGGTIGTRRPVYCSAIGKALVAFLPESELTKLLTSLTFKRRTPQTITSVDHFRRELVQIRKSGYAVDNEEFEEGLRCLAAPIFNSRRRVIATIGISGPAQRLNSETMLALAEAVKDAAAVISRELGYSLLIMDELRPG